MSASLVGSEMCIRDRFSNDRGGHSSSSARGAGVGDRRIWAPPRAAAEPCLLYTSDAADDM
eukprot:9435054-Alexandrium_andersonii.AAC.1